MDYFEAFHWDFLLHFPVEIGYPSLVAQTPCLSECSECLRPKLSRPFYLVFEGVVANFRIFTELEIIEGPCRPLKSIVCQDMTNVMNY